MNFPGDGINIRDSSGNHLLALLVNGNSGSGIRITGNLANENRVDLSWVFANESQGILLEEGAGGAGAGNVISSSGILNNKIFGVLIRDAGTDHNLIDSSTIHSNEGTGVFIGIGAANNVVHGNTIRNNGQAGVAISGGHNNLVSVNCIGLLEEPEYCVRAAPNAGDGIVVSYGATCNAIGAGGDRPEGCAAMDPEFDDGGNVISGNGGWGISVKDGGTNNNTIRDNLIGRDGFNEESVKNTLGGIVIAWGPFNTRVSGNTKDGPGDGIRIENSSGNVLGPGNSIFNFDGAGVSVVGQWAVHNRITRNSIFQNGGLGIDLGGDGVTPNDAGDPDSGPNDLLNFPEMITNDGTLVTGKACPVCTVEVFDASSHPDPSGFGEGPTFVGAVQADSSGDWSISASVVLATATATDPSGNTSEFACNVPVNGVCQPGPVGGTVELLAGGSDASAQPPGGSGAPFPYAAIAGGAATAAVALAVAAGGWYARRRFRQRRI